MLKKCFRIIPLVLFLSNCGTTLINPPREEVTKWKDEELEAIEVEARSKQATINAGFTNAAQYLYMGDSDSTMDSLKEEAEDKSEAMSCYYANFRDGYLELKALSTYTKLQRIDAKKIKCWESNKEGYRIIDKDNISTGLGGLIDESYLISFNVQMDKELLTAGNMKQFVARSMDPNAGSEAYEKMDMYVDSLGGNIVNSFKLLENKGNGNFVFGTSKPFTFKVNYKLYEDEDPLKFTFTYDEVLITYKDYLIDNYYLQMTYEFSIGSTPYTYSLVNYVDYEYNVENPFNVTYENPDVERSVD